MKKIIAAILTVAMLLGAFAVTSFAKKDTEIDFSVSTVEGTPGDTVRVDIYLDKNPGIWCAKFFARFNSRYFTLLSVENGEVFSDGEFAKGLLTNNGFYEYYADGSDPDVNKTGTGRILTLVFEISKACPNGSHEITLDFPDNGYGWFLDATEFPDFPTVFDVSCKKTGAIIVTGSDATESPETDKAGNEVPPAETKPAPGIPVTEAVTNEEGETVKNDDGSVMTEEVKDSDGNVIYYETDDEGDVVTDEKGDEVTFVDTTASPEDTTGAGDENGENGNEGGDPSDEDKLSPYKIILIAAIAAVVIGAVIVIIVVAKPKKKEEENN